MFKKWVEELPTLRIALIQLFRDLLDKEKKKQHEKNIRKIKKGNENV